MYDSAGERVRKVVEKGNIKEERLYFGDYEIYRKFVSGVLETERTTVNISDDKAKIATVDTLTVDQSYLIVNPTAVIRYQLDNHLGSASLELDETADIISYEEYHPFGTTSYRSGRTETETSLKRYKYVGKERDEETGLYYYGFRYYAAWLCRFVSVDPLQFDYPYYTPFQYAGNKPITYIDLDGLEPADPVKQDSNVMLDDKGNEMVVNLSEVVIQGEDKRSFWKKAGDFLYENVAKNIPVVGGIINAVESFRDGDILGGFLGIGEALLDGALLVTTFGVGNVLKTGTKTLLKTAAKETLENYTANKISEGLTDAEVPMWAQVSGGLLLGVKFNKGAKKAVDLPKRMPKTKGNWETGTRGNGRWKSDKKAVNDITNGEGIPFKDGFPDFSKWSKGEVKIKNLDGTSDDFKKVYEVIMTQKGLKSKNAAKKYLKKQGLTPHHHQDGRTIQFIPTKLHKNIPHTGGASILRNSN